MKILAALFIGYLVWAAFSIEARCIAQFSRDLDCRGPGWSKEIALVVAAMLAPALFIVAAHLRGRGDA